MVRINGTRAHVCLGHVFYAYLYWVGPGFLEDSEWSTALIEESEKTYWKSLQRFVSSQRKVATIFPPEKEVFSAFRLCPLSCVRVVILGQDPYHGPGQAHGLAFSVQHGVQIPPSLRNMVKEAAADVGTELKPQHGCLEHWSTQGVLLLNTVLTVRKANANSHKKQGWEQFTDSVIKLISARCSGIVFLLWGKPSILKAKLVDSKKHHILKSTHPSPLSATRGSKDAVAFIGSRCFSRTNELLEASGGKPIDWSIV